MHPLKHLIFTFNCGWLLLLVVTNVVLLRARTEIFIINYDSPISSCHRVLVQRAAIIIPSLYIWSIWKKLLQNWFTILTSDFWVSFLSQDILWLWRLDIVRLVIIYSHLLLCLKLLLSLILVCSIVILYFANFFISKQRVVVSSSSSINSLQYTILLMSRILLTHFTQIFSYLFYLRHTIWSVS